MNLLNRSILCYCNLSLLQSLIKIFADIFCGMLVEVGAQRKQRKIKRTLIFRDLRGHYFPFSCPGSIFGLASVFSVDMVMPGLVACSHYPT